MRRPIIAGNWKMYKTIDESIAFVNGLQEQTVPADVDAVLCAPYLSLPALVQATTGTAIGIGAQNVHQAAEGAYTGEISLPMLTAVGVQYAIIGHSERRAYFNETDSSVNEKAKATIASGITPIICVGELLEERETGQTNEVVRTQVTAALADISATDAAKVIIAYEPVWAIGTGKAATAQDAEDVCAVIRELLTELYDEIVAEEVRIQYGGSVKPGNIASLMAQPNIDGALVGGASLEAASFAQLLQGAKS